MLLSYELLQMTLLPDGGAPLIDYRTAWRPSGGEGLSWSPAEWLLAGVRVPREPRAGDAHRRARDERRRREEWAAPQLRVPRGRRRLPWTGAIFDPGAAALDRHDGLAGTASFKVAPTLGVEQAIVGKRLWLRAGLDETTWAVGPSVAARPFKPDIAVLRNLAAERTGDVFGKSNVGAIATLTFDYLAPVARSEATKTPGDKTD